MAVLQPTSLVSQSLHMTRWSSSHRKNPSLILPADPGDNPLIYFFWHTKIMIQHVWACSNRTILSKPSNNNPRKESQAIQITCVTEKHQWYWGSQLFSHTEWFLVTIKKLQHEASDLQGIGYITSLLHGVLVAFHDECLGIWKPDVLLGKENQLQITNQQFLWYHSGATWSPQGRPFDNTDKRMN